MQRKPQHKQGDQQVAAQARGQPGLAPPTAPAGRPVAVVTDLDRTFSRSDLSLDPEALAAVRELRRSGICVILATGRRLKDLPEGIADCFDALALEGGAAWGKPGRWRTAPTTAAFWAAADQVRKRHGIVEGWSSFSAPVAALGDLEHRPVALHVNADRVDVTPPGVDKAHGVRRCLLQLGLDAPWILAVGDGPNDVPLLRMADAGVAVANAPPELAAVATLKAPSEAHAGFLWAVSNLAASGRSP